MGPLCCFWAHLDHLQNDNDGVIDLNKLLEIVEQCVILIGRHHSRGSYFRRQRVLPALFKDRCSFEKKQKFLFGENFQKKVRETIKAKNKAKELLKEYTKSTSTKRPYHYGSLQPLFRQSPHSSSLGPWHQLYQNQGPVPRDGQRTFYPTGERDKLELQPPCDTSIQHKSETKNTRPFKFRRLQKN